MTTPTIIGPGAEHPHSMKNTTTTVATLTETHEAIQVKGGKFHRPKQTTHARMEWLKPMPTECGYTVTPLNVFNDIARVLEYTGGHREHLCAKCFPPATLMAHTPGPWRVTEYGGEIAIHAEDNSKIALPEKWYASNRAEAEANARLIAASPCLLAALEKMVALVAHFPRDEQAEADHKAARAAIAKATKEGK
jgi:hypothetical protein